MGNYSTRPTQDIDLSVELIQAWLDKAKEEMMRPYCGSPERPHQYMMVPGSSHYAGCLNCGSVMQLTDNN